MLSPSLRLCLCLLICFRENNIDKNDICISERLGDIVKRARRLGGCTRCLSLSHNCFDCTSTIRCAICFNYGHKSRFCVTRSRPDLSWRPKQLAACEKPAEGNEEPTRETEGAECHGISSPIPSLDAELQREVEALKTPPSADTLSPSPPVLDISSSDMANFAVNPDPFVPDGLELEDWARPARGRIIVSGNPPRQH